MTCQIDILILRKAGDQNIEGHAQQHDQRGIGTELLEPHRDDGFVVRYDALHMEGFLENFSEGRQRRLKDGGPACQNEKAYEGFDTAADDVSGRFFLQTQTENCDKSD